MASIFTHAFVAVSIVRLSTRAVVPGKVWTVAIFSSILPDLDVVAFNLCIAYESALGHRGFSHSLSFAVLWGLFITWAVFRDDFRSRAWLSKWLLFSGITASHGMLDALTNGGLGIGFAIPLSNERYFFPWTPVEVSPVDPKLFFSEWGKRVIISEMIWIWLPIMAMVAAAMGWRKAFPPGE